MRARDSSPGRTRTRLALSIYTACTTVPSLATKAGWVKPPGRSEWHGVESSPPTPWGRAGQVAYPDCGLRHRGTPACRIQSRIPGASLPSQVHRTRPRGNARIIRPGTTATRAVFQAHAWRDRAKQASMVYGQVRGKYRFSISPWPVRNTPRATGEAGLTLSHVPNLWGQPVESEVRFTEPTHGGTRCFCPNSSALLTSCQAHVWLAGP